MLWRVAVAEDVAVDVDVDRGTYASTQIRSYLHVSGPYQGRGKVAGDEACMLYHFILDIVISVARIVQPVSRLGAGAEAPVCSSLLKQSFASKPV
jgi:hypothetical protein